MQVAFTVHAAKLDFFKESKDVTITDAIQIEDSDSEMYRVTFEFPEYMTIGMICQFFLHSGISYGLDLKYSSYDNEPSRMR